MNSRSAVLRGSARRDVEEAVAHYLDAGGAKAALGFIEELEGALGHISRHPGSGSPRCGQEVNLAGLCSWPLTSYPHVVFYMEGRTTVDVWRVLHGRRDIPASLREGP
ncbi:type II toxin-antitoxin system RelE/ParE family toxin [Candidatus Palauibacter sp.]|uniref:type II toxin-antitoxin system RelE/ParE family toxin n=1 Tax=Candidatus Palauibacter sp. TaxID=3101350 RepID=UPI003B5A58C6